MGTVSVWGDAWGFTWGSAWGWTPGGGTSKRKKKRGRTFRFSDYESKEAYAAALKAAMPVVKAPVTQPEPIPIENDDDEIIKTVIAITMLQ